MECVPAGALGESSDETSTTPGSAPLLDSQGLLRSQPVEPVPEKTVPNPGSVHQSSSTPSENVSSVPESSAMLSENVSVVPESVSDVSASASVQRPDLCQFLRVRLHLLLLLRGRTWLIMCLCRGIPLQKREPL